MKRGVQLAKSVIESDNVINFEEAKKALIVPETGGPTNTEDWLMNLKEGAVFVARNKQSRPKVNVTDIILELFFLQQKKENVCNLLHKLPDGRQMDYWVRSLEFSRMHEHVETLAEVELVYRTPEEQEAFIKEQEKLEEEANGNSDRPV